MKDASAGVFVFPEGDFRNCAVLPITLSLLKCLI